MRVAVISDVHGNAFALDAVLADLRAASPDLIVNLGDQIEGSADPARAAALQAALAATEVRGNNEEKLWPGGRRAKISLELGAWLETQLDAAALARLAALPLTAHALDGRLFACHGTPHSAWDMLLWEWQFDPAGTGLAGSEPGPGAGFYRARDPRELRAIVGPLDVEVVVCGHTHRPGATRVGDTLVVNTGPVSDQVDGDPRARWTLLEHRAGQWAVDFRAVPFDIEAAVRWSAAHSPFGAFEAALMRRGEMVGRGG